MKKLIAIITALISFTLLSGCGHLAVHAHGDYPMVLDNHQYRYYRDVRVVHHDHYVSPPRHADKHVVVKKKVVVKPPTHGHHIKHQNQRPHPGHQVKKITKVKKTVVKAKNHKPKRHNVKREQRHEGKREQHGWRKGQRQQQAQHVERKRHEKRIEKNEKHHIRRDEKAVKQGRGF